MTSVDLSTLRRWPDVEADNLFAYDATDRLILDLAEPLLQGATVAIIGDNYGALTKTSCSARGLSRPMPTVRATRTTLSAPTCSTARRSC
jgi:hypothetical protein